MAHECDESGFHLICFNGDGEGAPKLACDGRDHNRSDGDSQGARESRRRERWRPRPDAPRGPIEKREIVVKIRRATAAPLVRKRAAIANTKTAGTDRRASSTSGGIDIR